MVLVILSSELTVGAATQLAERWQWPQYVVAILLVGLGTSLPELSISLAAIFRRRGALSIGNLIGSNIFDTLIPIGVAAIIYPLPFGRELLMFDLPYLILMSLIVLVFFYRNANFTRFEAGSVLTLYCLFVVSKLLADPAPM
jgi:cation:H+ antiporter